MRLLARMPHRQDRPDWYGPSIDPDYDLRPSLRHGPLLSRAKKTPTSDNLELLSSVSPGRVRRAKMRGEENKDSGTRSLAM